MEKYSRGRELFDRYKAISTQFALDRDVCLQTEVNEVRWDPDPSRWTL